jgi:hypothetical protein
MEIAACGSVGYTLVMKAPDLPILIDVDIAEIPALKSAVQSGGIRPFRTVERRKTRVTLELANDAEVTAAKLHAPSIQRS